MTKLSQRSLAILLFATTLGILSNLFKMYGVTYFPQTTSTTTSFSLHLTQGRGLAGYSEYSVNEEGLLLHVTSKGGKEGKITNSKILLDAEIENLKKVLAAHRVMQLQSENCFLVQCPLDAFVWKVTVALAQEQYSFSCRPDSFWLLKNNCATASAKIMETLDRYLTP